ncbi:MAG: hypothetical protein HRT88_02685 [Lentisphaeraceae bacterium]|nr:hypothetical protein [Lentisphaeraceae bacterium]
MDIAIGLISRIIQEDIETLRFTAQEQSLERQFSVLSLFRLDFIAQIKTVNGEHKNVLIEIQKAKLSSDMSRFREYLGKQYLKKDEVTDKDGFVQKRSLPIITIYFLGFTLASELPASVKVKRQYLDALTNQPITARHDFIEALTHDAYIIQIPQLHLSMQSELERVLSIFEQTHFTDEKHHSIDYERETDDSLLRSILRRLHRLRVEEDVQNKMDLEDQLYAETMAAIAEKTQNLHRQLDLAHERQEEERRQKEEACHREDEERRQKEEACHREEEERRQKEEALLELKRLKEILKKKNE